MLESIRTIATAVFGFLALAVITNLVGANIRELARRHGWDTYLARFFEYAREHPTFAAWYGRMMPGWAVLRQRWWLWGGLGLSGGIAFSLWFVSAQPELTPYPQTELLWNDAVSIIDA